jgi:hypothetical protein
MALFVVMWMNSMAAGELKADNLDYLPHGFLVAMAGRVSLGTGAAAVVVVDGSGDTLHLRHPKCNIPAYRSAAVAAVVVVVAAAAGDVVVAVDVHNTGDTHVEAIHKVPEKANVQDIDHCYQYKDGQDDDRGRACLHRSEHAKRALLDASDNPLQDQFRRMMQLADGAQMIRLSDP